MRMMIQVMGFLLAMPVLCAQHTYYVSPSGDDQAAGSVTAPWQHLQYGIDHMAAGDTLILLDGVYREKIIIRQPGIHLRALHLHGAVLDGTGLTNREAMIDVENASHILIQGLEIRNNVMNDAIGIRISGQGDHIVISENYIHDIHFSSDSTATATEQTNAQGIIVLGTGIQHAISGVEITGNELAYCRLGYSEGIALNGNVKDFIVAGNHVHHLTNIGIDLIGGEGTCPVDTLDVARDGRIMGNKVHDCLSDYATSAGIYVDGGKRITIMYNRVQHNGYGIEIGCEHPGRAASGIYVRNNFLLYNAETGLALGGYDYPAGSGKVNGVDVSGNTFWMNDSLHTGTGSLFLSYVENAVIRNNIFVTDTDELWYGENNQPGLVMDYNLYYDTDGQDTDNSIELNGTTYDGWADFRSRTSYETHGYYRDPHLVTGSGGLPRLSAQSPVDNGDPAYTPLPGETDYFGRNRIAGAAVDTGAEEYDDNQAVASVIRILSVYPNPVRHNLYLPGCEGGFYTVWDMRGHVVDKGMYIHPIPVEHWKAGVYWLWLHRNGKIFAGKFIKE